MEIAAGIRLEYNVKFGGVSSLTSNGCLAYNCVWLCHWFPVHHAEEPKEMTEINFAVQTDRTFPHWLETPGMRVDSISA